MKKFLFWFISCTWGCVMTALGILVAVPLIICGCDVHKFGMAYYIEVGRNWGGLEFGPIFLVNKNPSDYIVCHEYGHSFQNLIFGPFYLLLWINAAIRYWLSSFGLLWKSYRDNWLEKWATKIGVKAKKS